MNLDEFSIIKPDIQHAEEICNLLVKSITVLCIADHNNDPKKLTSWLSNKTPNNVISVWPKIH